MPIVLFHGSNHIVEQPDPHKSKNNTDYGKGFYTTTNFERAEEWALMKEGDSIVNQYEISPDNLCVCNLDDYGLLVWIAEVIKNRGVDGTDLEGIADIFCARYCIDLSNYDIVVGYRADDSYFRLIEAFVNNRITLYDVVQSFHIGLLGQQMFIKSNKAFSALRFSGFKKARVSRMDYVVSLDRNIRARVNGIINKRTRERLLTGASSRIDQITFNDCIENYYVYDRLEGRYHVQSDR